MPAQPSITTASGTKTTPNQFVNLLKTIEKTTTDTSREPLSLSLLRDAIEVFEALDDRYLAEKREKNKNITSSQTPNDTFGNNASRSHRKRKKNAPTTSNDETSTANPWLTPTLRLINKPSSNPPILIYHAAKLLSNLVVTPSHTTLATYLPSLLPLLGHRSSLPATVTKQLLVTTLSILPRYPKGNRFRNKLGELRDLCWEIMTVDALAHPQLRHPTSELLLRLDDGDEDDVSTSSLLVAEKGLSALLSLGERQRQVLSASSSDPEDALQSCPPAVLKMIDELTRVKEGRDRTSSFLGYCRGLGSIFSVAGCISWDLLRRLLTFGGGRFGVEEEEDEDDGGGMALMEGDGVFTARDVMNMSQSVRSLGYKLWNDCGGGGIGFSSSGSRNVVSPRELMRFLTMLLRRDFVRGGDVLRRRCIKSVMRTVLFLGPAGVTMLTNGGDGSDGGCWGDDIILTCVSNGDAGGGCVSSSNVLAEQLDLFSAVLSVSRGRLSKTSRNAVEKTFLSSFKTSTKKYYESLIRLGMDILTTPWIDGGLTSVETMSIIGSLAEQMTRDDDVQVARLAYTLRSIWSFVAGSGGGLGGCPPLEIVARRDIMPAATGMVMDEGASTGDRKSVFEELNCTVSNVAQVATPVSASCINGDNNGGVSEDLGKGEQKMEDVSLLDTSTTAEKNSMEITQNTHDCQEKLPLSVTGSNKNDTVTTIKPLPTTTDTSTPPPKSKKPKQEQPKSEQNDNLISSNEAGNNKSSITLQSQPQDNTTAVTPFHPKTQDLTTNSKSDKNNHDNVDDIKPDKPDSNKEGDQNYTKDEIITTSHQTPSTLSTAASANANSDDNKSDSSSKNDDEDSDDDECPPIFMDEGPDEN